MVASPFFKSGRTLAFASLLGATSPLAQAAESPFPNLAPVPPAPDAHGIDGSLESVAAIANPLTPLAPSMSVEASGPQFLAQVVPTEGATQTQVSPGTAAGQFNIGGGIQAGDNLFHRFDQLDLQAGQIANFITAPGLEAIFSQIGGGPSQIDGLLKVTGSGADLFLINPAGILLGPNARLDLSGSFVATTADRLHFGERWIDLLDEGLSADTAVAGALDSLEFSADAAGGIVANQGQLSVADGQSLGLLGQAVINSGSLTAPSGEVTILAAQGGQRVSLAGGLLNVDLSGVTPQASQSQPSLAEVESSVAEATGLSVNEDGSVSLQAGTAVVTGQVDVSSGDRVGGTARILGHEVQLAQSVVDASGTAGGQIQVGGDYQGRGEILRAASTSVDETSVLRADGRAAATVTVNSNEIRPDGGEVIVWSDGKTEFAGTASARSLASGGDGGLVETSGKQQLAIVATANVNTTAVDGTTGQWLIDPVNLTVVNSGGTGSIIAGGNDPASSTIDAATVVAGLDGNNISLQADNSITVDALIDASANASGGDLTLDAPTLNLNEQVTLRPGSNLSGTGITVNVGANGGVQNGIDAAATGGTINLAAVTYREGQEISLDKAITLQGQGIGNTILSGDAANDDVGLTNLGDNHRVMSTTTAAAGAVIDGLTIANGVATSGGGGGIANRANGLGLTIQNSEFTENRVLVSGEDGGGIENRGSLTVLDSRFERNTTLSDGGAIDINNGAATIVGSTFIENSADDHAGAVDFDRGTLNIIGSTFLRNAAGEEAGAINTGGALTVIGSTFEENTASIEGGAIRIEHGDAEFIDSNFIENTAVARGGAIFHAGDTSSSLTLRSTAPGLSLFQGNRVTSGAPSEGRGGAIHIENAPNTTVTGVDFVMNQATNDGGAIVARQNRSNITITDSNFRQNTSTGDDAGAVYISNNATLTLNGGSFSDNTAVDQSGALSVLRGAQATITGTAFSNNTVDNTGGALGISDATVTLNNTVFEDNRSIAGPGGAIAINSDGNLTSTGTRFTRNTSDFQGGAISILSGAEASLSENVFQNNEVLVNPQGHGGAIFVDSNSADALTVTGGDFTANSSIDDGGAVTVNAGTAQFTSVSFVSNLATADGHSGAIDIRPGATVDVQTSNFVGNRSRFSGGAIHNAGTLFVNTSTFNGNVSEAQDGGAIAVQNSGLATIQASSFIDNQAEASGGAVDALGSTVTITNSEFLNNRALNSSGGAIDMADAAVTVNTSTFTRNLAADSGGAIHGEGQLQVSGSSLIENEAVERGGAIAFNGTGPSSQLNITGSTFTRNRVTTGSTDSGNGGAIYADGAPVIQLDASFLAENVATQNGGAIALADDITATLDGIVLQLNQATNGSGGAIAAGNNADLTLANFIVQSNASGAQGGGLSLGDNAQATIRDGLFQTNTSGDRGGAIADAATSPTSLLVQRTTFDSNNSAGDGGAISSGNSTGTARVEDSLFTQNTASQGGAISAEAAADIQLIGSTLDGNTASSQGGGISSRLGSQLQVERTVIQANQANGDGGGLFLGGSGQTTILDSTVDGNTSVTAVGGGLHAQDGHQVELSNSTFSNNQADLNGGGIDLFNGVVLTASNVTLSGNEARNRGGGLSLESSTAALMNLTVTNNQVTASTGEGGGLSTSIFSPNAITLSNSIVAGNQAPTNADVRGVITSGGNNLVQDRDSSTGYVASDLPNGTDPQLLPLANNAGLTQTHALRADSLAIDASGAGATALDQRGLAAANIRDIGAYELDQNLNFSITGGGQTTTVNQAFANPITVTATDSFGIAIPGLNITPTNLSPGAAAILSSPFTTDNSGNASATATANTIAGSYSIALDSPFSAPGTGTVGTIALTNLADAPSDLQILSGNNQSTTVDTPFAAPLLLEVRDQFGNAVSGASVTFSIPEFNLSGTAASANLSTSSLVTDGAGRGQIAAIANGQAGNYAVQAQAGTAQASFDLTNFEFITNDNNEQSPASGLPMTGTPVDFSPSPAEPPAPSPSEATSPAAPTVPIFSDSLSTPSIQTTRPNLPSEPSTGQAPLSFGSEAAIAAIDSSFSSAYRTHWGNSNSADSQGSTSGQTVAATRALLQDAATAHGVNSAVIYGLFVPKESRDDPSFGQRQAASIAIGQRARSNQPRDDDQLMLVLVPSQGEAVQRLLPVTRVEVLRQAKLFRRAVADPEDEWSYKPLAQQMYSWMLEPVEPDLARLELDNIMYALDTGLRTIPLAAMMDGDQFAIERYGISLIPSVDLLESHFGSAAPPAEVLAAGATEFEQLDALPAVELELDAIAARTNGAAHSETRSATTQAHPSNILLNETFTQTNLTAVQTQQQSKMMHLATHAEFKAGDVSSSYLQFWDSRLTFDQISQMGWDELELLILSACQTAIGSPEAGLGFAGLAAATGVESTIGSLWNISDIGTLALMSEFYGQLNQQPLRFEALRQAQLALSRGQTQVAQQQLKTEQGNIDLPENWSLPDAADFSHPFYWSGFTLVGNPWW